MNRQVLGARVEFIGAVWSVWSGAPGQSCYWLARRDDVGKTVFVKARLHQGEWLEVRDDG